MRNKKIERAKKKFNSVVEKFNKKIEELEDLICKIPQKGDTPQTCQRINIHSKIKDLEHSISGLCVEDFLE